MGALVKACDVSVSLKNTGIECSSAMGPTAMIIAVPSGLKWTSSDLTDFAAYIQTKMHAAAASRVYPLFGNQAPIRTIQVNDSDDVVQTYDDGSEDFIRSGFANRVFETNKGGLCYASALRSFIGSGYAFLEIDKEGNIAMKKNADGTYSGFPCVMGGRTPAAATFTTKFQNRFGLSYDPTSYINNGVIMTGAEDILDYTGLLDVVLSSAGAATTTTLKIAIATECAETDLVDLLGADIAQVANFIVTEGGVVITPSAAVIENGYVKLTIAAQTSADVIRVALAAPSVLKTNGIEGYEMASDGYVDITIP